MLESVLMIYVLVGIATVLISIPFIDSNNMSPIGQCFIIFHPHGFDRELGACFLCFVIWPFILVRLIILFIIRIQR